ncbi:MAG: ATP-dependent helicase [Acidimicrobiales bacterium]
MASTVTGTSRRLRPERFLQGLNPRQLEAVKHGGGPLLVLAGAGSGKTKVLTSRIGYLIASGAVAPEQVLAITFTNKAAKEMKERLAASLGPLVKDMWVSTFHSACVRMLRPYADRVGLTKRFTILSEDDCKRLLRDIADDLNIDVKMMPPGGAKAAISAAKNRLVDPRQLSIESSDARSNAHARAYREYQQRLVASDCVDFDDLLVHVVTLLTQHPDVREHYRARFAQVLVDEYQDTNRAQSVIVEELASGHGNLCCVGDGDQSIYGFRAADVGNILNFTRTFPGATSVLLEQNFRSTGTILDAANAVIAHNADRPEKNLWTDAGEGSLIALRAADDEADEASWLADEVATLVRDGARPGDIAVLCRAKTLTRPIEAEVVRRGIPCRTVGGTPFFERKEIRDLTAYLRLAVNPHDELSFRRCVNLPRRAVGDASVKKVRSFAQTYGLALGDALDRRSEIEDLPRLALAGLDEFARRLDEIRRAGELHGALGALDAVLADGEYLRQLVDAAADDEERIYRQESVEQLRAVATDHPTIDSFLDMAGLITDADDADDDRSRLVLMTIHAAKGLEFPAVFVVGMEEGIFPDRRCMEDEQLEEERRLAYVAITRAERRLYLSHARTRRSMDRVVENERSRFLDEIPEGLLHALDVPWEPSPEASDRFTALRSSLGI